MALALVALTACSDEAPPKPVSVAAPDLGACRLLDAEAISAPSNDTASVDCADEHTAMTYAVGPLPTALADAAVDYESEDLGAFAFKTCSKKFIKLLGADESLAMRTVLSWAWFRPSKAAWDKGARWYRCDVVGGGDQIKELLPLPEKVAGLLARPKDDWLVCAQGPTVDGSVKVPCTAPHDWRAISTIKLGEPEDEYPGDRVVEVKTRDYCSDQVGAWLNYPIDYDFGYTWFHEPEWKAGNRRSVCWAKTTQ